MTREAFDLSERYRIPVLVRLVTRLAHSRTQVDVRERRVENPIRRAPEKSTWILLPQNARRQWKSLVERQGELLQYTSNTAWNQLTLDPGWGDLGVITTGIARNYFNEACADLPGRPSHLHIGAYPVPAELLRRLSAHVRRILVLEDGNPFIETRLHGYLAQPMEIMGRTTGHVPATGELTPDVVRAALGLPARPTLSIEGLALPGRPPQLCEGCPHTFAYRALQKAMEGLESTMVTSDIGCYTLGALPPYSAIETCVCMGASVGMAKGAAEAGVWPVVAVIGDSTFLHSGITPLMDAAAANVDMTLLILDNRTVGMTGTQDTIVPSSRLEAIVGSLGVQPEHFHVIDPHPRRVKSNAEILRREIEYHGLSVIIARRACKQVASRFPTEQSLGAGASQ